MTVRKQVLISIFALHSFCACSQNIIANYIVNIKPIKSIINDTAYEKIEYGTYISSKYCISQLTSDSIEFKVKNWVHEFGPTNLSLSLTDTSSNISIIDSLNYLFDGNKLTVFFDQPPHNLNLSINYTYIGSTFIAIPDSNLRNIVLFGGNENFEHFAEMFFVPQNCSFVNKSLKVHNHTDLVAFCSLEQSKEAGEMEKDILEFKFKPGDKLNNTVVILLDTSVYKKNVKTINSRKYNFYIRNKNLDVFNTFFSENFHKLDTILETPLSNKEFNVIEMDWRNSKGTMGRVYSNVMVMDISFLTKHTSSFIHEYLHSLLNHKKPPKDKKGFYIINESLIEYLAVCIDNGNDLLGVDTAIEKKKIRYNANDTVNLYELSMNSNDSFNKVYSYGPVIIHELAREIGIKPFFNIVVNYFITYQNELTYDNFIEFLWKNNVESVAIEKFDLAIRQ